MSDDAMLWCSESNKQLSTAAYTRLDYYGPLVVVVVQVMMCIPGDRSCVSRRLWLHCILIISA